MAVPLKQSTAVTIVLGPFVDQTDGFTAETALTLSQADIRLSKNGGAFAQANEATSASHMENGHYSKPLSTTDTNTLGLLRVAVNESGALPVWIDYVVLAANVYDSLIGGGDVLDVSLIQWLGAAPNALVSSRIDASVGAMAANTMTAAAAAADLTTELQANLATAAALATVQADTDDIQTRLPAALVSGRMDANVSAMAAGVVTAAAVATNAIDADALAADAVTEIAAGVSVSSAPTAAQNAAAVWNEAIASHLSAGSTGAKLNGLSGASGSGAITVTGTITSGGNPVDGALVWITTDALGVNVVASGVTDTLGHVTVFLDAGTYYKWAQRGGINFIEGAAFVVV